MKITNLKINNFGKLQDKNIDFKDGINVIYGENEAGKSTLLKFIISSLYGINRNKAGNYTPDYEHYMPWNQGEYSGKLSYKLDDGKKFEVYRDFRKKSPKIFNENMEDITKEFSVDKSKGSRFFVDQTGVEEELFLTTIVSEQKAVQLDEKAQAGMVQKMTNILGTGENNISYKNTISNLNKKIINEIGTKNTKEKPINILEKKKKELEDEINYIKNFQNEKYEIEETKKDDQDFIIKKELELDFAKKLQQIEEENVLEKEKIKVSKEFEENQRKIISELEEKADNIEIPTFQKLNKKLNIFVILLLILIGVLSAVLINSMIVKIIVVITTILGISSIVLTILKNKKKNEKNIAQVEVQKKEYEKEIEKQEKILKQKIQENNQKEEKLILDYNNKKNDVIRLFEGKLATSTIKKIADSFNINTELNRILETINEAKLNVHRIELEEKNIIPKLEELAQKTEALESVKEEYEQLMFQSEAIQLAKEMIEQAYDEMKNSISPKFTDKLSETISKISNNKYNNVCLSDEYGLVVENEQGDYIPAEALSVGTIEELYLSLRLATIDDISSEKLPIIFDETFAYFDDIRLENLLKFIKANYGERQLIILTCTKREQEILTRNNMKFNVVNL